MEKFDEVKLTDYIENDVEEKQGFIIDNDLKADWTLEKIQEAEAEFRRFEMVANARMEQIKEALEKEKTKFENTKMFFSGKLYEYFLTVKTKDTKASKTYTLPSGKLKLKFQTPEFKVDNDTLAGWLKDNEHLDLVKTKEEPKWVEVKPLLESKTNVITDDFGNVLKGKIQDMDGYKVVIEDETGEVIDSFKFYESALVMGNKVVKGVSVTIRDPKFEIEIK